MRTLLSSVQLLLAIFAGCVRCAPGFADTPEPSVLVRTAMLRQEPLKATLTTFGTLAPATGAVRNVNVAHAGEIVQVTVSAGAVVKKGALLLIVGTDPSAAASYEQARAAVEFARSELQRTEGLLDQRLATRSQLASARKALADAQATLEAQRRLGAGNASEEIRAPFDAVVTSLAVHEGDRFQAGAQVLQLAKVGALRAQLGVEPEDVSRVAVGMKVELVSVFDQALRATATIDQVHGVIDPQTRLVDVLASLDHGAGGFIPGTQVRGMITLSTQTGWVVPRAAVLSDDRGAYVFQVRSGHAKRVQVRVTVEQGELIGISGELDPTLPVVVLGNYEVEDGMAVRERTR